MEIHYSYEDIEDYEDYEDPEGTMLAHREELGLPPPIPLAEPWELGPPVLIRDEPSWPMTNQADRPVQTKPSGVVDFGQEDEVANLIAADWYDDVEGLIADEIEDHRRSRVTAADAIEDVVPGTARSVVAGGPGRSGPGAGPLGPWASLDSSDGPTVGSASEAAVRPPARDPGIQG